MLSQLEIQHCLFDSQPYLHGDLLALLGPKLLAIRTDRSDKNRCHCLDPNSSPRGKNTNFVDQRCRVRKLRIK